LLLHLVVREHVLLLEHSLGVGGVQVLHGVGVRVGTRRHASH
jgi:hypothetical protein